MIRPLSLLLLAVCLFGPGVTRAAEPKSGVRIAMVLWRGETDAERGFRDYLRESGMHSTITTFDVQKDAARLPAVIAALRAAPPDLIYTFGTTVTKALADAFAPEMGHPAPPIVFNVVADPLGAGLTDASGKRHRNLTGVSHLVPYDVQLKSMLQLDNFNRIGMIYNTREENSRSALKALGEVCTASGVVLESVAIDPGSTDRPVPQQLLEGLQSLRNRHIQLLYLPSDSLIISQAKILVAAATAAAIPSFSATEEPVRQSGALLGVVSRYYSVGKFAGHKAWQILKEGVSPGDLPMEPLKRFSVLVNMESAQKLDFYPPVKLLRIAEIVQP